jgi:hypothetical protein
MEVVAKQFVHFIPIYGVPHSGGNKKQPNQDISKDDDTLKKMEFIKTSIKNIIENAVRAKDDVYIFGDLQDTPDNSNKFH